MLIHRKSKSYSKEIVVGICQSACDSVEAMSDFDIRTYGAAADGVTDDSEAIKRAVEACAAAGGGSFV
jgi:polygalacturonase